MAVDIIRTHKDQAESVQIPGGLLLPHGEGGVPVERAARDGAQELLERNPDGTPRLDEQGALVPLTDKNLKDAAKAWVARYEGVLEVASIAQDKVADLPAAHGVLPDRPPAEQVAVDEYNDQFGAVEPTDVDAEQPQPVTGPGAAEALPPATDKKERH